MASNSFPRPGYNGGSLTNVEHEALTRRTLPDSVYGGTGNSGPVLADTTATRTVKVQANMHAQVRGSRYDSGETDIPLTLEANTSGQPRIDRITLRLDRSTYIVKEHVLKGTPAQNPAAPALRQDGGGTGFWDFPLADVRVEHNASTITADKITRRCWYTGDDGQIRCDDNGMPPHQDGRTVLHTPSGAYLVSRSGKWLRAAEDSGAVSVAMHPGGTAPWVASHNVVWRRNGWAFMNLTGRRPTAFMFAGETYLVGTIPVGFRPVSDIGVIQTTAIIRSLDSTAAVAIHPNGEVYVSPSRDIPSNTSWVIATSTWPCDG